MEILSPFILGHPVPDDQERGPGTLGLLLVDLLVLDHVDSGSWRRTQISKYDSIKFYQSKSEFHPKLNLSVNAEHDKCVALSQEEKVMLMCDSLFKNEIHEKC